MRRFARLSLAAGLAAALLASAPRTALAERAAPQETAMSAEDAAKLVALYDALVDTAVKHAADCRALATGIEGVVQQHQATVQMSWEARKAKRTLPKDAQERLDRRGRELIDALRRCWEDAGVKAALGRLKPPKEETK